MVALERAFEQEQAFGSISLPAESGENKTYLVHLQVIWDVLKLWRMIVDV